MHKWDTTCLQDYMLNVTSKGKKRLILILDHLTNCLVSVAEKLQALLINCSQTDKWNFIARKK